VKFYVDEVLLAGRQAVADELRKRLIGSLEAFIGATLCRVNRIPQTHSTTANRRNKKGYLKAKAKATVIQDPLGDELEMKKVEYSHLLYKLNMNHLQTFLQNIENYYLVDHFYQNKGMKRSEKSNKPACRFDALDYLQSYSSD
jgi:hypothetical protein